MAYSNNRALKIPSSAITDMIGFKSAHNIIDGIHYLHTDNSSPCYYIGSSVIADFLDYSAVEYRDTGFMPPIFTSFNLGVVYRLGSVGARGMDH
jgi:hypothetical protein